MRTILILFALCSVAPLGGCAIVGATASVVGAAGTLVGVTANAAAGAVGAVAGGGGSHHDTKKSDCGDAPCAQPASTK